MAGDDVSEAYSVRLPGTTVIELAIAMGKMYYPVSKDLTG